MSLILALFFVYHEMKETLYRQSNSELCLIASFKKFHVIIGEVHIKYKNIITRCCSLGNSLRFSLPAILCLTVDSWMPDCCEEGQTAAKVL